MKKKQRKRVTDGVMTGVQTWQISSSKVTQHAAILPQENEEVKISGRIQGRQLVTGVEIA